LFRAGGTLSPRDINENLTHMETLVRDAQQQRYFYHVLRFPLQTSLDAPYTDASAASRRTYSVRFPQRLIIERAYLLFYGSGTAPVTVTRDGVPYLTVTPTASDGEHVAFNGDRVTLNADTQYTFVVTGTDFSSKATYLELHLRADRFNTAGVELAVPYTPALFRGGETRDAARILAETAKIDLAVDSVGGAFVMNPLRSDIYIVHDIADSPAKYTWKMSNVSGAQSIRRQLRGYRVWATRNPTLSTDSTTVKWRLLMGVGVVETWTLNLALGAMNGTVGGLLTPRSLNNENWSVECEGDAATTMYLDKTYLQLFYS
jgi:hypothetical protein